jgi:hypothetical protein
MPVIIAEFPRYPYTSTKIYKYLRNLQIFDKMYHFGNTACSRVLYCGGGQPDALGQSLSKMMRDPITNSMLRIGIMGQT